MTFHSQPRRYAYFVSAHGYGHAARAAAVMAAILELDPESKFDIYTQVPGWFFEDSIGGAHFSHFPLLTDIGLVQQTALKADLKKTFDRLNCFLPFNPLRIERLASLLLKRGSSFVL